MTVVRRCDSPKGDVTGIERCVSLRRGVMVMREM